MKNTNVVVARETVINNVVVRDGNRVFNLSRTANGVNVTFGKSSLFVPNGAVGAAVIGELNGMIGTVEAEPKAKRVRRTKAQIEADNAKTENGE